MAAYGSLLDMAWFEKNKKLFLKKGLFYVGLLKASTKYFETSIRLAVRFDATSINTALLESLRVASCPNMI